MINYYNENDPKAAAWLRELIKDGHIANGIVDERSIKDVQPNDLTDFTQCHFFAGIGGWSYALRLAGWPDNRPVWTGSCPCQPFSAAGKRGGTDDARHLWPEFYRLIGECRPATVFGEQVASKDGLAWLDIVSADLERADYAVGAADMCAAGVGAPHIRQRLYFVAESPRQQRDGRGDSRSGRRESTDYSGMGDTRGVESGRLSNVGRPEVSEARFAGSAGELAYAYGGNASPQREQRSGQYGLIAQDSWACDWIECTDGKWRPVEPLAQQMANGLSFALGLVRGFSHAEKEALTNAANSTGFTTEVLRQMRDGVCPAEIWSAIGRCVGFPETSILLAFLCEQSRELGRFFYGQTSGSAQEREAAMRAVHENWSSACTPQGREFFEQRAVEFRDAMPALPQESALLAVFNGFPLSTGVPARMGRLRGYGNAIVPQVAAEFVRATMDSGHGC